MNRRLGSVEKSEAGPRWSSPKSFHPSPFRPATSPRLSREGAHLQTRDRRRPLRRTSRRRRSLRLGSGSRRDAGRRRVIGPSIAERTDPLPPGRGDAWPAFSGGARLRRPIMPTSSQRRPISFGAPTTSRRGPCPRTGPKQNGKLLCSSRQVAETETAILSRLKRSISSHANPETAVFLIESGSLASWRCALPDLVCHAVPS